MCISMAAAAAIGSVISAATGAMSAMQQSQAAKAQANYQAQVANNNAIIAQQNAERLQQYGSIAEDEQRERLAATKASARVRLAGNGLLVDDTIDATGSLLQADLASEGEYDILKLKDRYAQQVQAAKVQGVNFQAEAGLASLKAAQQKPMFAAAGSLLGSAGSVYKAGKNINFGGGSSSSGFGTAGSNLGY